MATSQGVGVSDVVQGGVGLAFIVFPEVINQFPFFKEFFGFLFFILLVLAGLSSLMSITETYVAAIIDKFNISRNQVVLFGGGAAAIISFLFAAQGGMNLLDIADYFLNQFGVALLGLVEVVLIAWFLRKLNELKTYANEISDIRLGTWWNISLGGITPLVLGYMMYGLFKENIMRELPTTTGNFNGFSDQSILYGGWFVAIEVIVLGIILSLLPWKKTNKSSNKKKEDK